MSATELNLQALLVSIKHSLNSAHNHRKAFFEHSAQKPYFLPNTQRSKNRFYLSFVFDCFSVCFIPKSGMYRSFFVVFAYFTVLASYLVFRASGFFHFYSRFAVGGNMILVAVIEQGFQVFQ